MAQYRLVFGFLEGNGTVTINGSESALYYEEGTSITIETTLDSGYVSLTYNVNNGLFVSTDNPFTFTMPSRDIRISITASGQYAPIDGYGLKYFSEFCDITDQNIRLEILENGYGGLSYEKISGGLRYRLGSQGSDEFETIVGSSIDFGLVGSRDQYFDLLEGGARQFQVKLFIESNLFWVGYISNNFLTVDEISTDQIQRFTAVDGLKSLEAIRAVQSYFPSFAFGSPIGSLTSALNQSFPYFRPLNVACDIYETRMDTDLGLFEQFLVPANAIYTDGELTQYSGGDITVNTSVYISEFVENILRPFLCRVFLWKDKFYVISIPELRKNSYRLFEYDTEAEYVLTSTVEPGLDLSCKFTEGQRTGKPVFTEFTTVLKLGVLDQAARGGIYENDFSVDNWRTGSATSPYPNIYILRGWNYTRAIPVNQVNSYPEGGSPALIQYVSDSRGEYCKVWGTTSSLGLSDPLISFFEIDTYRIGENIAIAQETANTVSFQIEYMAAPRSGEDTNKVVPSNQFCGVMINIGDSWLSFDGVETFTWVGTETVMLFPLNAAQLPFIWNNIDIINVLVPEDGAVKIRLYEVINNGGTQDRYCVCYQNLSLKIEENDAFVTEEIGAKFITDNTYSIVFPEYEIKIGDVDTDNSSSAIKLNQPLENFPHSQLWSRDGIEEFPLLIVILQEIANLRGRQNPKITALVLRDNVNPLEVVPYQSVEYDGYYWMVTSIELDFLLNTWRVEIIRLDQIPSS